MWRVLFLVSIVPSALAYSHFPRARKNLRIRKAPGPKLPVELHELKQYSFKDFVRQFSRKYKPGTNEWRRREMIFNKRLNEVIAKRSSKSSWQAGITKFMDYTEQEFKSMMGYMGRPQGKGFHQSYLKLGTAFDRIEVPKSVNVNKKNSIFAEVIRDQGACGSCWAEAAVSVLEGAMELNSTLLSLMSAPLGQSKGVKVPTLSSQAMVSCTLNPRHCGGKGGCQGATVELAYKMVKKMGLPLAVAWPYESLTGNTPHCRESLFKPQKLKLHIDGYTVLPSNQLNPLKLALYQQGHPIAVSVDATNWNLYVSGIYSDTEGGNAGDFTVNHAVTLTGYQEKHGDQLGYWVIKNSWGDSFGENGYIRLEMKENEQDHCGWDNHSHDGLACDGDPDRVWVCGTCGVLYDSVYPSAPTIKVD